MEKSEVIKRHFKKVDPIIYRVIESMKFEVLSPPNSSRNYFPKLCREIITQQLAGGASRAITKRFIALFSKKRVTPKKVLFLKDEELREVGMSWAKARYIKDLALKVNNGEVDLSNLHKKGNEEVINELVKVKGIGRWTSEMFLIFTLGREDVFSHGDLGLKRALQLLYKLRERPSEKEAELIIAKWTPYKSYGSLALWESLDNG